MNLLYSAALAIALFLTLPYWVFQMLRHGKYRAGLGERLGRVPELLGHDQQPTIWVHAVSVGEVLAVSGVIAELKKRFPGHRLVISTTTAAGQKLARERFGAESVFFFPLDFAFALRPYFDRLRPALIIVAETEIWPNFFRLATECGAKVAVINARVSDRSFPRYRRFSGLLAPVLDNVELFLAQSREDAARIVAMGASPDRVEAVGNLKFDMPLAVETPLVANLRAALSQPVIVCGSTVEGEEETVLSAFASLHREFPSATLVLAPRHPERFAAIAEMARDFAAKNSTSFTRRTQWTVNPLTGGIFLLDTIGDLAAVYSLATLAFVGGSLVPRGGHNILEAARFGVPILTGPHTENFRDIMELFVSADAVKVVTAEGFASELLALLRDPGARQALGARAQAEWRAHSGGTERTLARIEELMSSSPTVPQEEKA